MIRTKETQPRSPYQTVPWRLVRRGDAWFCYWTTKFGLVVLFYLAAALRSAQRWANCHRALPYWTNVANSGL